MMVLSRATTGPPLRILLCTASVNLKGRPATGAICDEALSILLHNVAVMGG
jgi:hypothetical protein